MKQTPLWNGCWERREGRIICRWMVSWFVRRDQIFGAIAGYSGGGCFQLERFLIAGESISIEAFEELNFSTEEDKESCEECLDKVLSFHLREPWENAETLYLDCSSITGQFDGDLLVVTGDQMPSIFLRLFAAVGLITRPKDKDFG
jgi:hypothetical protein